ncbi:hypothetical protein CGLO_10182 [Colletotrichum gloeosporioides Cg-14]|uniref:Uncharacterized protein n=1 Tax=Colletotrichum gloeosporioides (strain Cg-14) TaxID=1237896 RepID=T0LFM6_COLGC|nr:hypothetical protein CGLO_10182 [Colletotrichum gloeosporioides Cg-14]
MGDERHCWKSTLGT